MTKRCTLDGFVITPMEPPGSLYAGTDHGRLFITEARTGVMAWWSILSLRSRGTHWRVQDGKPRKTQGIFCYSATKHRYTNMEKSLDISW
jgi:hypothetical protein